MRRILHFYCVYFSVSDLEIMKNRDVATSAAAGEIREWQKVAKVHTFVT
jgi:hypothetical protein